MRVYKPLRTARLIELQAALADAIRAADTDHRPHAVLPPGMKWLVPPREALEAREGDATTIRTAFDLFHFWRLTLGAQIPTTASLINAAERLRAVAIWQLAIRAQQRGLPLPLKDGKPAYEVPAPYVSQMISDQLTREARPPRQPRQRPARRLQEAAATAESTRDATTNGASDNGVSPQVQQNAYQQLNEMLDFWGVWGAITPQQFQELANGKLSGLMPNDSYWIGGNLFDFETLFGDLEALGMSQQTMAGVIDAWYNQQATLWAAQDIQTQAGIAGTFQMTDPYFYDYLRNQAGYRIVQIYDITRQDMAHDLWTAMGGSTATDEGWFNTVGLGKYIADRYRLELEGTTKFSADWRGYMISATETVRAENFGAFVSLYATGATQKIWIANYGACAICLDNADAGPVDLLSWFPSGVVAPPQHPLCRCAISSAIPDTFNVDDWQSRNPNDLAPLLTNWTGAGWPDVDLADMGLTLADMPDTTRSTLSREHALALGEAFAAVIHANAVQWLREAHVRMPDSEADMKTLARRLRKPDEVPDAREADEQALHRLKRDLTAAAKTVLEGEHGRADRAHTTSDQALKDVMHSPVCSSCYWWKPSDGHYCGAWPPGGLQDMPQDIWDGRNFHLTPVGGELPDEDGNPIVFRPAPSVKRTDENAALLDAYEAHQREEYHE